MIGLWPSKMRAPGSRWNHKRVGRRGSRPARPSGFPTESPPGSLVRRCRGHDAMGSRHRPCRRAACTRSRWYPWRCAWCRHRRPSQVRQHLRKASVAVPAGLAPSPAPLPCGAAPACAAASASLPSASRAFSRASIAVGSAPPEADRPRRVSCRRFARRLSANSEKARENVASLGSRPAPLQPHSRHSLNLKTLDQAARRRNVEHGLGYEGARQRRAVLLRTPYLAAEVEEPQPAPVPEPRRRARALAHRAELALQPRLVEGVPVIR